VDAISNLERGRRRAPRRDTVVLLAGALCLAPAERAEFEAAARRQRARGPVSEVSAAGDACQEPSGGALIGREREIAEVSTTLRGGPVRLLTLTGPPGVGKTSVALAAAATLAPTLADGVRFVGLGAIDDPAIVGAAVARALGLRQEPAQRAVDVLAPYLAGHQLLLVLDNFEHVTDAADLLVELMRRCPEQHVLVTSRVPLRLRDEHEFPVQPLPLPSIEDESSIEMLGRVPAVALFVRTARSRLPQFRLTAAEASPVAEICRRTEGLPLAIELAAAWVKVLRPAALRERLEPRLAMLVDGPRDLPDRQRTMRGTIRWSCDLLDPPQLAGLRRLSVFAGGAPLAALEPVCGAAGPLGRDALAVAAELVDRSLAFAPDAAEPRIQMLETIREYARELLDASGDDCATRRAHAAWCLSLTEGADAGMLGGDQPRWLALIEAEHANIRAALRWSVDGGEVDTGLRLCLHVRRYWDTRGLHREALGWLDELLALPDAGSAPSWARAMQVASGTDHKMGDYRRAVARAEASLARSRAVGDRRCEADALLVLGQTAFDQGQVARGAALLEESLSLSRAVGDGHGSGAALTMLAGCHHRAGDHRRSMTLLEEVLRIERRQGNSQAVAVALTNMGTVARATGDLAQAAACLTESARISRELGNEEVLATTLNNLGELVCDRGAIAESAAHHAESLQIRLRLGLRAKVAPCLAAFARVCWLARRAERSARLYAAAAALREAIGVPEWQNDRARHGPALDALRAELGEERFAAAWSAGWRLSAEQAAAEVEEIVRVN
jgi:predicted ATPase